MKVNRKNLNGLLSIIVIMALLTGCDDKKDSSTSSGGGGGGTSSGGGGGGTSSGGGGGGTSSGGSGYNCPFCPLSKTGVIRVGTTDTQRQNAEYYDAGTAYCTAVTGYNNCLISGNFTPCGGGTRTSILTKAQNACTGAGTQARNVCNLMTGYTWTGTTCIRITNGPPVAVPGGY